MTLIKKLEIFGYITNKDIEEYKNQEQSYNNVRETLRDISQLRTIEMWDYYMSLNPTSANICCLMIEAPEYISKHCVNGFMKTKPSEQLVRTLVYKSEDELIYSNGKLYVTLTGKKMEERWDHNYNKYGIINRRSRLSR